MNKVIPSLLPGKASCNCLQKIQLIESELQKINLKIFKIAENLQFPHNIGNDQKEKQFNQDGIQKRIISFYRHGNTMGSNYKQSRVIDKNTDKKNTLSPESIHAFSLNGESEPDSLLLENLQFYGKSQEIKKSRKIVVPCIGSEISLIHKKISAIQQEIKMVPQIKKNISMLTKIMQGLQQKTQKLANQIFRENSRQQSLLNKLNENLKMKMRKQQNTSFDSLCLSDDSKLKENPKYSRKQIQKINFD